MSAHASHKFSMDLHFGFFQLLYWVAVLLTASFASAFLLARGFRNAEIGLLFAFANILSIAVQMKVSSFTDHRGEDGMRRVHLLFFLLINLSCFALLLPLPRLLTGLLYLSNTALVAAALPALNALGMQTLRLNGHLNFPLTRAMGSLGYAAFSFLIGHLLVRSGENLLIYALLAENALYFLTYLFLQKRLGALRGPALPQVAESRLSPRESFLSFLRRTPGMSLLLCAYSCTMFCHMLYANFTLQILRSVGADRAEFGIAGAICALLELIPLLLLFHLLRRRFSLQKILLFSSFSFALKALSICLSSQVSLFYLSQIWQIFAYGLFTVATVYYAGSLVDERDETKAQSVTGTANCIGAILSGLLGGPVLDRFPILYFHLLCIGAGLLGTFLLLLASRRLAASSLRKESNRPSADFS